MCTFIQEIREYRFYLTGFQRISIVMEYRQKNCEKNGLPPVTDSQVTILDHITWPWGDNFSENKDKPCNELQSTNWPFFCGTIPVVEVGFHLSNWKFANSYCIIRYSHSHIVNISVIANINIPYTQTVFISTNFCHFR